MVDVGDKFSIGSDALRHYVKANNLARPDGNLPRPLSGQSPRQVKIKETYDKAMADGHDATWALKYANAGQTTRSINKGDFVYYAVKNSLPEIPDPNKKPSSAFHKMSRI